MFDGRLGRPYVESDVPCPSCVYGASKAEAERRVLDEYSDALIIRTSAVFGPWDKYNFVYHSLCALASGGEVLASANCVVSPTYVRDLVTAALDVLIDGEISDVFELQDRITESVVAAIEPRLLFGDRSVEAPAERRMSKFDPVALIAFLLNTL